MKNKLKYYLTHLAVFFVLTKAYTQVTYYQDVYYGGICVAGGSPGSSLGTINFNVHIEPGSTIKKAWLLYSAVGVPVDYTFKINNINYILNYYNSIVTSGFNVYQNSSIGTHPKSIHMMDITDSINTLINNYTMEFFQIQDLLVPGNYFLPFYLIILYENSILPKINSTIILNDKDATANIQYNINNLMPINNTTDVGLSVIGEAFCSTVPDGSYIHVNNNNLGLIGGADNVHQNFYCPGTQGHFYYQNNTLYGLDDDTPDNIMGGTDALANIQSYIPNLTQNILFNSIHQDAQNPFSNITTTNPIIAVILSYTTPCDTFSVAHTKDTAVCKGDSLQLYATGGINYEWLPQQGLSCYNCPNPVFYADSSRVYTLRVWSTDSCSKVLPIRLGVLPLPTYNTLSTPATCGLYNDGTLQVTGVSGPPSYIYHLYNANYNNTWTSLNNSKTYPALDTGTYTLSITNGNGCTNSSNITIAVSNNANTQFTATPTSGNVPLNISLSNQSTGVNNCYYLVNNTITNTPITNNIVTIYEAGEYTITLICFLNDTLCADTATTTIYATQEIIIPTGFSPNADGINDTFVIQGIEELPNNELYIYNRWGELVYSAAPYQNQFKGESNTKTLMGKKLSDGTYFYVFKLTPDAEGISGFLELKR